MLLHHQDNRCEGKRSNETHPNGKTFNDKTFKGSHSKGNPSCRHHPGRQYLPKWLRFLVPWFLFAEGNLTLSLIVLNLFLLD